MRRDRAITAAAIAVLVASWGSEPGGVMLAAVVAALVASVLIAVRNAEAIAHRLGEPFGTLVLAVCVTLIEVGLILSLMIKGGASTLARDTVFAAVMIVANGVVGLAIVVAALRHRVVTFNADAASGLIATLAALAALTMVLPTFTESTSANTFTTGQLALAAVCAITLYGVFVIVQTVIDRRSFVPEESGEPSPTVSDHGSLGGHLAILVVCLVVVVILAKSVSPALDDFVELTGATESLVGVLLAAIVLLPETIAAVRAASRNQLQSSLNLAFGSGIASIGLTVPAVALATIWVDTGLVLGLDSKELVLLVLTIVLNAVSLSRGRATVLNGTIHLMVLLVFVFLAFQP